MKRASFGDKVIILEGYEAALDAYCMSRGTSLPNLDAYLAGVPCDDPNLKDLSMYMARLRQAVQQPNMALLDACFDTFLVALKAVVFWIPDAEVGKKTRASQAARREGKPGKDCTDQPPNRNELIRRHYARLKGQDDPAPVEETAKEFGLSKRQIHRIVSKEAHV